MTSIMNAVLDLITSVDVTANRVTKGLPVKLTALTPTHVIFSLATDVWEYGGTPHAAHVEENDANCQAWDRNPVDLLLGTFLDAALYFRSGVSDAAELANYIAVPIEAAICHLAILHRVDFWMSLRSRRIAR